MENNSNLIAGEGKIDVSYIIDSMKRNWWMFVLSFVLCIAFAGVYLYVKNPLYYIQAKVLVAQDTGSGSMGATLMQSLSLGGVGGNTVEDEILVMDSHSILAQVISELRLNREYSSPNGLLRTNHYYNDSPIEINAPDALFDTLSVGMGFKIEVNRDLTKIKVKVKKSLFNTLAEVETDKFPLVVTTPYGIFSVDTTKYYVPGEELEVNAYVVGNSLQAENYSKSIGVIKSEKKANGITLSIDDVNIKRGKDILNKIIELYNRRGQQEKDEMAVNTGKFIEERLQFLYADLSDSESKIEDFKRTRKITEPGTDVAMLISKSRTLENQLVNAETEFEILGMNKEFLSNPENKYSLIPNVTGDEGFNEVLMTYNESVLEYIKLKKNAKSNNATLQTLQAQIDAMRDNILVSLDKNYENASVRLDELRAQTVQAQSKLSNVPSQEREYLELLREQTIRNTLYSFLLQKKEENQLVLAATTPKGKIVDNAYSFNEPLAPKKGVVVLVAIFLGLMLPALWLYVKPLLSNKFDSQEAFSRLTNLPILGEVCHSRTVQDNPIVVNEKSNRPIAELFRLLRNNLQFMLPITASGIGRVITVTSSCSGEGKTFISMNMAESLALMNKKVVLVGLDIRLPMIAQNLGLQLSPGVTNYLSGGTDNVSELVQRHGNCDIIVAGPIPPNPSELLLGERLEKLIDELKRKYEYVVLDSAPIGLVSDTFSLTKFTEVILYVTRVNYTKRTFIRYLNSTVNRGQLKNVAVILNDTNPKMSHGYGYGYGSKES